MNLKNIKLINAGYCALLSLSLILPACKKDIEVGAPIYSINAANIYQDNNTAASVLTGIYGTLSTSADIASSGLGSTFYRNGLSADELVPFDPQRVGFAVLYKNQLSSISQTEGSVWISNYQLIYRCNAALEGLTASSALAPSVKQQLLGEAKFLRAFHYFNLTNLFGKVPLALSTDYKVNSLLLRAEQQIVYEQILEDLKEAKVLLSDNYLDGTTSKTTTDRVRPNKSVATALLSRVYLYKKDYAAAEAEASLLINNTAVYDTVTLANVFLKHSKETIWSLQPVKSGFNTDEGATFLLPSSGPNTTKPFFLSNFLLNAFEPFDKRRTAWVSEVTSLGTTYRFASKYKVDRNQPVTEHQVVFRLAEQYLIRAEARAMLNNISGSQADLNVIRKRAGLGNTTAASQADLLLAIEKERQIELFTEWGHRWFDLKRTGRVDVVMPDVTAQKGGTWKTEWQLYPIPQTEFLLNPNLDQNPGYQQ